MNKRTQIFQNLAIISLIIIIFSLFACKDKINIEGTRKDTGQIHLRKWEKEYPEYYKNRFKYYLDHYNNILNVKNIIDLMKTEAPNMINLIQLNNHSFNKDIFQLKEVKYENSGNSKSNFQILKHITENSFENESEIIQIEYPSTYNTRKKCLIISKINYNNKIKNKCFYVQWSTKPDHLMNFEIIGPYKPCYMWGINKTTDTLLTNLTLINVKKLFPQFEGIYIFKTFKEIIIDYSYETSDISFYWNIEFVPFEEIH